MQAGDVEKTYADITQTRRDFGFSPEMQIGEGLRRFADWYLSYFA